MTVLSTPLMGAVFNPQGRWMPIWETHGVVMGTLFMKAMHLHPPHSIWRRIRG